MEPKIIEPGRSFHEYPAWDCLRNDAPAAYEALKRSAHRRHNGLSLQAAGTAPAQRLHAEGFERGREHHRRSSSSRRRTREHLSRGSKSTPALPGLPKTPTSGKLRPPHPSSSSTSSTRAAAGPATPMSTASAGARPKSGELPEFWCTTAVMSTPSAAAAAAAPAYGFHTLTDQQKQSSVDEGLASLAGGASAARRSPVAGSGGLTPIESEAGGQRRAPNCTITKKGYSRTPAGNIFAFSCGAL